ncbi:methyltransferase [Amycolatopsis coloradensis]|uniref:S-adenosyl-L-methionine-dependent methyltransferase n=1 Tax=Amycolatopsis coloradensis TaxID=76021 RepID=A0A1R0KEB8_9PSEU|nr:SAM-dependent methyltransferase [Amycolatopsis coloradensis]OLZ43388.1 methyltransferase [Amycolatopsis coloradensis]
MDAVSYTAQWTAAARAVETEREDGWLIRDELARELAAPRGFDLLDKYGGGGLLPYIAIRTRFFDDTVTDVLGTGEISQVVLIAAGMDARVFRLPWPDSAVVYEVDHGPLLAEKRARLARLGAAPKAKRVEVAADLAGDWVPALVDAGFDRDRPTLWVAEGLLFFLSEEQATGLLRTLAAASARKSGLAVDMVNRTLLRSPISRGFLDALAEDGTPWLFGTDEPEAFLAGTGWQSTQVAEPGQQGAGEGRWPYPVQPRERRGASRSWLVRAELR